MSQIDDKYHQLSQQGFNLGAPAGAETASHSGGRMRAYERGHIYWHANAGAHEVHGGILDLYLKTGGPGPNPATGARDLGYPKTDEVAISGEAMPMSWFEFGAIYWVRGTGGCVLHGSIFECYKRTGALGLPLTSVIDVAGGKAAYFERGVIFSANGAAPGVTEPIVGLMTPPLMGRPLILHPNDPQGRRLSALVTWHEIPRAQYNALTAWRPNIFADIWQGRLALSAVNTPTSLLPLTAAGAPHLVEAPQRIDVHLSFEVAAGGAGDLKERTLYHINLNLPRGVPYQLSPHAVYAKSDWANFGLLHITDLHICKRNNDFRARLQAKGLTDAAQRYSNYQDNLRDFIKYANRLHELGLADAVVATGDLVDYVSEKGDDPVRANFERLRRILRGEGMNPGEPATEALAIPIYMTFGNHDYRLNPYDLRSNIDLPTGAYDKGINEHSTHNLLESDAIALQDGVTPTYTLTNVGGAGKMLEFDRFDNRYQFFKFYFTSRRTYVVPLGKHRLVVMDTKYDNGIPDDFDIGTLLNVWLGGDGLFSSQFGGGVPATQKLLNGGGPDSVGVSDVELSLLVNELVAVPADSVVIVGMHCPALSPKGSEYAYFHRETIHPTADPALTDAYLKRHKIEDGGSWTKSGTPYFKTGDVSDGMNSGVIAHNGQKFLEVCAGANLPRAVDLVLCGHHHDRVEYRLKWNAGTLEYYTDFYSENPPTYYHSVSSPGAAGLPDNALVQVKVEKNAALPVAVRPTRDHSINLTYGVATTPEYPQPLNAAADPRAWWSAHRPLLAQTSALGPIDPRQRFGTFYKLTPPPQPYRPVLESDTPLSVERGISVEELPGRLVPPTFQGFRLVQVRGDVIARIRYIVLGELRRNNFAMPWEGEFLGRRGGEVNIPRNPTRDTRNG